VNFKKWKGVTTVRMCKKNYFLRPKLNKRPLYKHIGVCKQTHLEHLEDQHHQGHHAHFDLEEMSHHVHLSLPAECKVQSNNVTERWRQHCLGVNICQPWNFLIKWGKITNRELEKKEMYTNIQISIEDFAYGHKVTGLSVQWLPGSHNDSFVMHPFMHHLVV
jgi:hypothetical protein